jgi:hypothetical protein
MVNSRQRIGILQYEKKGVLILYNCLHTKANKCPSSLSVSVIIATRPAWAGFKTEEEGIAISKSYILQGK